MSLTLRHQLTALDRALAHLLDERARGRLRRRQLGALHAPPALRVPSLAACIASGPNRIADCVADYQHAERIAYDDAR